MSDYQTRRSICSKLSLMMTSALLVPAWSPAIAAPPTPTENKSAGPEEIIVEARRRGENIQVVPVAVTALITAVLQQQRVLSAFDLPRLVPSLNVNVGPSGQGQPSLAIRAQRQSDSRPAVDPSIGIYLGDIVLERPYGFGQSFYDLDSVQVLKGPQGTLFGRNTTGGAILIQPNLPGSRYDAEIHATLGNYNLHEVDGYVNLPFSEKVQLRIAGQHTDRDGYIRDVLSKQDDANENESAARASLRLRPTADFENVTVANFITRHTNATGWKLSSITPGATVSQIYGAGADAALAQARGLNFYDIASATPGFSRMRTYTVANTTTYHLSDTVSVKNIIGYDHYRTKSFDDLDGSPLPILAFGSTQRGTQITEELQLIGSHASLNWIAGGYYFRESGLFIDSAPEEINPVLNGTIVPQVVHQNVVNRSRSIFGSVTYDMNEIIPRLSVTAGGRYTGDSRHARFGTIDAEGYKPGDLTPIGTISPGAHCAFASSPTQVSFLPLPDCTVSRSADFSKFTYNVDIDYKIASNKMIYLAHRLGYRTGGFNGLATSAAQLTPFSPETVRDYELGAKLEWRTGSMFLRTNFAAYLQNYKDIQRLVPIVTGNVVSSTVLNAASARIYGGEFEFLFIPAKGVELSGFANLAHPRYNSFDVAGPNGSRVDISRTAIFGGFPRTTFGLTGRLTLPTPEEYGPVVIQVNFNHQGSLIVDDSPTMEPDSKAAAYSLVNLRLEWNKFLGTTINVALFADNLLDKKYVNARFSLNNELGFAGFIPGRPRMIGVEARYRFGQ